MAWPPADAFQAGDPGSDHACGRGLPLRQQLSHVAQHHGRTLQSVDSVAGHGGMGWRSLLPMHFRLETRGRIMRVDGGCHCDNSTHTWHSITGGRYSRSLVSLDTEAWDGVASCRCISGC